MKIKTKIKIQLIIATTDLDAFSLPEEIACSFNRSGIFEVEHTIVRTVDELIAELMTGRHHFIVAGYLFDDIDIWRLSKLVHSELYEAIAIPIYLLQDESVQVPAILARANQVQVTSLATLAEEIARNFTVHFPAEDLRGVQTRLKPTVLIIEDHFETAEILQYALSSEFLVTVTHTGAEGLRVWERLKPDMVLLDYLLPDINGDRVLANIMAVDRLQPVIMMTGVEVDYLGQDMILLGASDHYFKPLSFHKLIRRIKSLLSIAQVNYLHLYLENKLAMLSALLVKASLSAHTFPLEQVSRYVNAMREILGSDYTEHDYSLLAEMDDEKMVALWPELAEPLARIGRQFNPGSRLSEEWTESGMPS